MPVHVITHRGEYPDSRRAVLCSCGASSIARTQPAADRRHDTHIRAAIAANRTEKSA